MIHRKTPGIFFQVTRLTRLIAITQSASELASVGRERDAPKFPSLSYSHDAVLRIFGLPPVANPAAAEVTDIVRKRTSSSTRAASTHNPSVSATLSKLVGEASSGLSYPSGHVVGTGISSSRTGSFSCQ
ncbi:hypothetical protein CGLO_03436 [Colletotrichum gloeosporioides Cg-14]|uniref:Uncharacterized protein n=1 Tax=Colletotrichum gloeosporioides (strain Cg-14) TaxID=1237896 RepID=T0LYB1_COLGC|nr:hypothetical protein CGLO_03436 [Colletotrichum gloeosporioides Cg-14]